MMKITDSINVNTPALMRPTPMYYKHHFLHMACECPYDRHSSCTNFNATVSTSPYEGHTSHPIFHDSFIIRPGYSIIHLGFPKYYIGYV